MNTLERLLEDAIARTVSRARRDRDATFVIMLTREGEILSQVRQAARPAGARVIALVEWHGDAIEVFATSPQVPAPAERHFFYAEHSAFLVKG